MADSVMTVKMTRGAPDLRRKKSNGVKLYQTTLRSELRFSGVGLHGGKPSSVILSPMSSGTGVQFQAGRVGVPALAEYVVDTKRGTTLGKGGVAIRTVEHLLSAIRGMGVDNVLIRITGEEIPAMDGSAAVFAEAISKAGLQLMRARQPKPVWELGDDESFVLTTGLSSYKVFSSKALSMGVSISFPGTPIGLQDFEWRPRASYLKEVSRARTFCLASEVPALRQLGLAKGGDLSNTIVVGAQDYQSQEPLRYRDECVRHKVLDLVGDLSLLGPGDYRFACAAFAPSHTANFRLVQELRRRLKRRV